MKKMLFVIIICLLSFPLFAEKWRDYVPDQYENLVEDQCNKYRLPVDIVVSIGYVESCWKNVEGYTGDIGIFQLNKWYITYYEEKFWERKMAFNPWNPYHNIELSIRYIHWLYHLTDKNWEYTIKSYNVGINRLRREIQVYPTYADPYYFKVMRALSNL